MNTNINKEQSEASASGTCFALPEQMTAESTEALWAEMKERQLDIQSIVVCDFSHVSYLMTPGLQLILSLEKSLSERNGKLSLANTSPQVEAVFRDLGFERLLTHTS